MRHESGLGFIDLLQIAFIVLKLCNVIDWSWVYVLMPLIAMIVLGLLKASARRRD